jgi:hypothetical protein
MTGKERCRACGSVGEPLCASCRGLTERIVEAHRTLELEWGAAALGALVAVASTYAYVDSFSSPTYISGGELRLLILSLFVSPVLLGWAYRGFRRPHRLVLRPGRGLEIHRTIGRTREVPVNYLVDDLGAIVISPGNERLPTGGHEFDGAEVLHRALRARLALLHEARRP